MSYINSCPHCQAGSGLNEGVLINSDMGGEGNLDGLSSYVYCRKCKARGPLVADGLYQRVEAVDLWNTASYNMAQLMGRLNLAIDMCDEGSKLHKTLCSIKREAK